MKYFMWRIWKYFRYQKFLKLNAEFDWEYLIDMMVLKLTLMGLEFAKFGVSADRRKMVRSIWAARKQLKRVIDAYVIAEESGQRRFEARYGKKFQHSAEMPQEDSQRAEEIRFWYKECNPLNTEDVIQKEALHKAFLLIEASLFEWWD